MCSDVTSVPFSREYQDGGADEEDGSRARGPSLSVRESLAAEDGNVAAKVANVTSNVVGKVGNKVRALRDIQRCQSRLFWYRSDASPGGSRLSVFFHMLVL